MGTPPSAGSGLGRSRGAGRHAGPLPRQRPTAPVAAALLLATLALAALTGCRPPSGPAASATQSDTGSGPVQERDGRAPLAIEGRLLVMALDAAGERNQALALDPASGQWRELWATSALGNVSDWRPAPDGRSVVYRIIQRSSPEDAIEALILRGLDAGAQPCTLVVVDASKSRLAGFAWAPDGSGLAFGLQAFGRAAGGAEDRWTLRAVAIDEDADGSTASGPGGSDGSTRPEGGEGGSSRAGETRQTGAADGAPTGPGRLLWTAPEAPDQALALALEAYDPALDRAVLSQLAPDSGIVAALRLLDLAQGKELSSLPVTLAGLAPAAGPGGLALAEGVPLADRLRLLDLRAATPRELYRATGGASLGRPLWSADGRLLAAALYPAAPAAAGTELLLLDPAKAEPAARFSLPGGGAAPLAFSPDGQWLLAQSGEADQAFGSGLTLLPTTGGRPRPATFALPTGSWALSWLP